MSVMAPTYDTSKPQPVAGRQVVRIRQVTADVGFALCLYICTHPHGRRALGPRHFSRKTAAAWAEAQGWTVIGAKE